MERIRPRQFRVTEVSFSVFVSAYATLLVVLYGVAALLVVTTEASAQPHAIVLCKSWTIANAIHCFITVSCLHWPQGSHLLLGDQGALNGMTIWEQLEVTFTWGYFIRRSLWIVPTMLCYVACLVGKFNSVACSINFVIYSTTMVGKLPMMNGVRLFGVHRNADINE